MVEQRTHKPLVVSSNLTPVTTRTEERAPSRAPVSISLMRRRARGPRKPRCQVPCVPVIGRDRGTKDPLVTIRLLPCPPRVSDVGERSRSWHYSTNSPRPTSPPATWEAYRRLQRLHQDLSAERTPAAGREAKLLRQVPASRNPGTRSARRPPAQVMAQGPETATPLYVLLPQH